MASCGKLDIDSCAWPSVTLGKVEGRDTAVYIGGTNTGVIFGIARTAAGVAKGCAPML